MLDPATGELVLRAPGVRLGPAWTRARFLESPLGARAEAGTVNAPWARYHLACDAGDVGPFPAQVTVQFRGEALVGLEVMNVSPEFGTSRADHSEALEHARRAAHDRWLADCGAPAGQHPWAWVWSGYDSKTGFSLVVVQYEHGSGGAPMPPPA